MASGNKENLVSLADRTTEEQRRIATMGGKASGEARRKKKMMRETLEMLLDEKEKKTGKTYRELVTFGLFKGAMKGNAQNYKIILETLGELKSVEEDKLANNIGKVEDLLLKLNEEAKK